MLQKLVQHTFLHFFTKNNFSNVNYHVFHLMKLINPEFNFDLNMVGIIESLINYNIFLMILVFVKIKGFLFFAKI
ncbi:hypothetical protein BpHYR1_028404 [Brachionus plicatilis]|uniref:Uncharacterized protein n=1 Tax=Brachionus plicatilis TaxID=10195 RepID=A0A3M7T8I6_BRAPC|nr:hypothetical protein BpHYR1_028404 [Brachionus plicatilis]